MSTAQPSKDYPVLSFLYALYCGGAGPEFLADPRAFEKKYNLPPAAVEIVNGIVRNADRSPNSDDAKKLMALAAEELLATESPVW